MLIRLERFRIAPCKHAFNKLNHPSELYWTSDTTFVELCREGTPCPSIKLNLISLAAATSTEPLNRVGN
jgi:hypothetical protein